MKQETLDSAGLKQATARSGNLASVDSPMNPFVTFGDTIGQNITTVAALYKSRIEKAVLQKHDLSFQTFALLTLIWDDPAITQSHVARLKHVSNVAILKQMRPLLETGILQQIPAKHDKRSSVFKFTDKGKKLMNKLIPEAKAFDEKLRLTIESGTGIHYVHFLSKLTACMKAFKG